jgi:hypothetical protein
MARRRGPPLRSLNEWHEAWPTDQQLTHEGERQIAGSPLKRRDRDRTRVVRQHVQVLGQQQQRQHGRPRLALVAVDEQGVVAIDVSTHGEVAKMP